MVDGDRPRFVGVHSSGDPLEGELDRVRAGEEPTNSIRLARLSSLEHRHLKDALQAIRELQSSAAHHFQVQALG